MGMDVFGKNPANDTGNYFRAGVWGWRPLAEYLCHVAPALMAKVTYLGSNDGDGLDAADSLALAEALDEASASGHLDAYAAQRSAIVEALPREKCDQCQGTGTRRDAVGERLGYTARGWCNGCDGKGDRESFEASYVLDVDHVREFAGFVRHSGGFEIW